MLKPSCLFNSFIIKVKLSFSLKTEHISSSFSTNYGPVFILQTFYIRSKKR